MKRLTMILLVSLFGLAARSPAQVHFGVSLGERVAAHARVGAVDVHVGSLDRAQYHVGSRHRSHGRSASHSHTRGTQRVSHRVWVPGRFERVYRPAQYREEIDECGRRVRILVCGPRYENVWREGYWQYEYCRVTHRY